MGSTKQKESLFARKIMHDIIPRIRRPTKPRPVKFTSSFNGLTIPDQAMELLGILFRHENRSNVANRHTHSGLVVSTHPTNLFGPRVAELPPPSALAAVVTGARRPGLFVPKRSLCCGCGTSAPTVSAFTSCPRHCSFGFSADYRRGATPLLSAL